MPFGDLDRQKEERVYVVTYGKYNNGSLFYIWLDLSDYVNKEEFLQRLSVAE